MPTYTKDVSNPINENEAQAMINNCTNPRDQALIAFLYLTGARPCEANEIRGKHFEPFITTNKDYFALSVYTAKRSKKTGYNPERRRLEIPRSAPTAKYFINYAVTRHEEERLFPIGTIRVRQIIWKTSKDTRPPYAFRHSRMQKLSDSGASEKELMSWKGASDLRSVSSYLKNKPIGRQLTIT